MQYPYTHDTAACGIVSQRFFGGFPGAIIALLANFAAPRCKKRVIVVIRNLSKGELRNRILHY